MQNIIKEELSDFDIFFKFLKDHLEPITREILNIFLEQTVGNTKILNQIANEIQYKITKNL